MKGQISFEHIMLVAFAVAVLVPGVYFFYVYSQGTQAMLSGAQYAKLGEEMISTAQEARAQGSGTWLQLDANLPEKTLGMNVSDSGRELVFTYQTSFGKSKAVFFSDTVKLANASGNDGSLYAIEPHVGRITFRFSVNDTGAVWIEEKT